jgi:Electron transfer DM13
MKQIILVLLLSLAIMACSKQNGSPATPGTATVDTTVAQQTHTGTFSNGPYGNVSGMAAIYTDTAGNLSLQLRNMAVSNGPDLHVYLSKELFPVNYIDLGRLQSTSGQQVYPVPGNPDFLTYKYALVHCQRFNHLFGSAELR